jgi:hypothetical protein
MAGREGPYSPEEENRWLRSKPKTHAQIESEHKRTMAVRAKLFGMLTHKTEQNSNADKPPLKVWSNGLPSARRVSVSRLVQLSIRYGLGTFSTGVRQRDCRKSPGLPHMIDEGSQLHCEPVCTRSDVFSQLSRPIQLSLLNALRTSPANRAGDCAWFRKIRCT